MLPVYVDKVTPDPEHDSTIHSYVIRTCLSRTRFALVYNGEYLDGHAGDWNKLALKFIKRTSDTAVISREIDLYQEFQSSHIVPLLDQFPHQEFHCLVFPYASGGDLELYMRNHYPAGVPESVAKVIAGQVFDALAQIHAAHIVHCDIKLTNILVPVPDRIQPQIWLCDFGISRPVDETENLNSAIGTPDFESPEVLQRKGFNGKADCWAFGVTLYRILARAWPFPPGDRAPIIGTVKFTEPQWKKISLQCKGFIKKLLTKDPDARMSAVEALKDPWLGSEAKPAVNSLLESVLTAPPPMID
jgi:serine/threonine protein kinase